MMVGKIRVSIYREDEHTVVLALDALFNVPFIGIRLAHVTVLCDDVDDAFKRTQEELEKFIAMADDRLAMWGIAIAPKTFATSGTHTRIFAFNLKPSLQGRIVS